MAKSPLLFPQCFVNFDVHAIVETLCGWIVIYVKLYGFSLGARPRGIMIVE